MPGPRGIAWTRAGDGMVTVEGPAALRTTIEELAALATRALPRLAADLGVEPAGPMRVVVLPTDLGGNLELFRLDALAPPWAAGFALGSERLAVIRMAQSRRYPFADEGGVLVHELAHLLIHDAAGGDLPRWLNEGIATREQRRWSLRDTLVYSSELLGGPLPTLAAMDRAFASPGGARIAYAASFDIVTWAVDEYGEDFVPRLLRASRERPFPSAWREASGVSLRTSEADWRRGSLALYRWIPALTGAGSLWIGVTALFLFAAWRRRVRTLALEARWEEEDRAARFAVERPDDPRRDDDSRWIH